MKRLAEILNWIVSNNINITSIYFDNTTLSAMIMYNNGDEMIELNDNDFIYYNKSSVKRFTQIRTEEIIKYLNGKL